MQLYALDTEGKKCFVRSVQKGNDYFCLECSSRVRARSGVATRPHFYHVAATKNCSQAGKTEEHIAIQELILGQIQDAHLEMRFDAIGRIADVFWEEKKLVFEVQCSPISKEEVEARNRDYESQGINVIWILYDKTFGYRRRTAGQKILQLHTHYYSDGKILYDMKSRFQKKEILASSVLPLSFSHTKALNFAMQLRFHSWAYYAKEDYLWQALEKSEREVSFSLINLVRIFKSIWQLILERSCK